MTLLYILFALIVLSIILITFIIIANNNFNEYIVRIDEANENIDNTLKKRFDLLNKSVEVIKQVLDKDEEDVIKTITEIRSKKLNNFDLDKSLYKALEEFYNYSEEYLDLKDNNDYNKIELNLIESESDILALKSYYNDIVKKYNSLVNKIPFNLVAKFKKYEEKQLFEIEDNSELINNLKQR